MTERKRIYRRLFDHNLTARLITKLNMNRRFRIRHLTGLAVSTLFAIVAMMPWFFFNPDTAVERVCKAIYMVLFIGGIAALAFVWIFTVIVMKTYPYSAIYFKEKINRDGDEFMGMK